MPYEFSELRLRYPDHRIRRAWSWLCRVVETKIEHLLATNGSGGNLTRGQVVYFSGNNQVDLASAAAVDAHPEWCGIVVDAVWSNGDVSPVRTDNVAYVRFEAGLNPAAGDAVYLSATEAGSATTAAPAAENTWVVKLGVIVQADIYAVGNPFCWVLLNNCCEAIIL